MGRGVTGRPRRSWVGGLLSMLALTGAACSAGGEGGTTSTGGGGGAGGSSATGDGGEGPGGGGGADATTSSSTGPVDVGTTIEDACRAGCERVEALTASLGCAETTECVENCVAYGEQLRCMNGEYLDFARCVAQSIDETTCNCGGGQGNLSCDTCNELQGRIQFCPGF